MESLRIGHGDGDGDGDGKGPLGVSLELEDACCIFSNDPEGQLFIPALSDDLPNNTYVVRTYVRT